MLKVVNPYNLQEIKRIPFSTAKDVEEALEKASQLHQKNRLGLAKSLRVLVLETLAKLVERDFEKIVEDAVKEGGKPLLDTRVEINRAILGIKLAAEGVNKLDGEVIPMDCGGKDIEKSAIAIKEPIGVVVGISAFNHPFNLIVHQVATAVAAGCPVIIKPALKTPISCQNFVDLLKEAGLPEGWCQILICEDYLTEKLATDSRVGYLSFIGSEKVGWMLSSKLAKGTRCALEHGGVAPVILNKDVDLERVVLPVVKGAFYHAGQVCVSVQKVYVPSELVDEFCKNISVFVNNLTVGNPLNEETDVGPIILPEEVNRIENWVNQAETNGATILCGGERISETMYEPTVLLNPKEKDLVSSEELFGPVLCVYSYNDLDNVIEQINSSRFAFQAAVFSKNNEWADDVVSKIDASCVMVNDHTAFRVDWMPFGGRKHSGIGVGGIDYTIAEMSQEKLIVKNINDL